MKIIKLTTVFILAFLIIGLTSFTNIRKAKKAIRGHYLLAQEDELYWFTVSVRIDDKTSQYKITGSASKLVKGNQAAFEKDVWYGIARRQIIIGPFAQQNEALNAKMLYKKDADQINAIPSEDNPSEVYWFFVTFIQLDRLGAYIFQRMPAGVASGNTTDFVDALYENITFKNLAVGPFWDYNLAEKSKALYRKNE